MPPQRTQSGLMAKLGQKLLKAHEAHKDDETSYGNFGELPGGINNGIAQLVDCRFGVFDKGDFKGEYFFYAAGVVVQPVEVNGEKIVGRRTSLMEAICDTPTRKRATIADHIDWVYNELRKLGVDTATLDPTELEATCGALVVAAPYFRFSTWKPPEQKTGPYAGKESRVLHNWLGTCDYSADGEDNGVDDETGGDDTGEPDAPPPAPPAQRAGTPPTTGSRGKVGPPATSRPTPASNGRANPAPAPTARTPATPANGSAKAPPKAGPAPKAAPGPKAAPATTAGKGKKAAPAPAPTTGNSFDEGGDLNDLVTEATNGNTEAQESLNALALERGVSQEEVDATTTWPQLLDLIMRGGSNGNGEAAEEEATEEDSAEDNGEEAGEATEEGEAEDPYADWVPNITDVFKYRPLNAHTGKRAERPVECEVVKVNTQARTCKLKNLTNVKIFYNDVPYEDLE